MRATPRIVLVLAVVAVAACGKKVPADMQPVLEAVRPQAEKVAEAAARECAAEFASGRFVAGPKGCSVNLLPGEKLVPETPSPAKGTPLETNPNVVDVHTSCMSPVTPPGANATMSCGNDLGSLRGLRSVTVGHRSTAESTCRKNPTDCEEVAMPSEYSSAPDAVDLKIVRPVSGGPPGSTAEVLVTLAKK